LFNIYINDIPSVENNNNVAISIYADGTNITVRSGNIRLAANKFSNAIKSLELWFKNGIKVSVNKCNTTLFSKRLTDSREHLHPFKIFHKNIACKNEIKCLGVILDSKLANKPHRNKSMTKSNHRLRKLYPLLNKSSAIDINLALPVYKALQRPIITYAAPARGYAPKTQFNKLEVFQNNVHRIITKLPRVTYMSRRVWRQLEAMSGS
jgi:hypothetical protein